MKYREISKLQSGGGVFFSAVANPFSSAAQQDMQSSSSSSSKSSDKILSDSIMNKLNDEALPNDFRKFMAMVTDFEQEQAMGFGVDRRKLYDIRTYANQIIQQSKYLKQAEEEAVKNGAWDEFAVDSRGFLYVSDENGQISKIAPNKFDPEKQMALTVGQLLQQRKENDSLVDRSDIATTVGNNIGIEKINDYILDIIKAVGSNETASEAYTDLASIVGQANAKRPNNVQLQAIQGIANELDKLGGDAIFKQKELMSSKNVQEALAYIMSVLPQNMKNQLMGRYVANGGRYEDVSQHTSALILNAINAGNDKKYHYSIDYNTSINKAAGNSPDDTKQRPQGVVEMFFNQNLNRGQIEISNPNYRNGYTISVQGSVIPSLSLDSDKGIDTMPLYLALDHNGNGMGKYLDHNKVWMGYDKANYFDLSKVLYTGNQVANVWLPVNDNGDIDWQSFDAFCEAEDNIKRLGITDPAMKTKEHRKAGSPVEYNSDGEISKNKNVAQFMMVHGYTADKYITSDNLLYRELDNKEEDQLDDIISQINDKYDSDIETSGLFTDLVQLPIFIKIQDNAGLNAAYYAHQGSMVDKKTLQDDQIWQMTQQSPTTNIYSSGDILYNVE